MPLDPLKYLVGLVVKAAGTVVSRNAKSINFTGGGQTTTSSSDEVTVNIPGGSGSPDWGDIGGTLTDQTDLQNALDAKKDDADIKVIYKSADETVNNSDVLQDDDHLTFAVGANEVWAFNALILINSGSTPDFKCQFSLPAGTTMTFWENVSVYAYFKQSDFPIGFNTIGEFPMEITHGVIFTSGTAGNVTFQWAQRTANASDTKVLKGSYIIAHKLA